MFFARVLFEMEKNMEKVENLPPPLWSIYGAKR